MDQDEIQNAIKKRMNSDKNYRRKMEEAIENDEEDKIIELITQVCAVIPIIAEIIVWVIKIFRKK